MTSPRITLSASAAALLLAAAHALALDSNALVVRREQAFEFSEKPTVAVARDSATQPDKFVISFAAKSYCGATVAIEETAGPRGPGRILRHLASGVLDWNAPPPFQKASLKQRIIWDGKDEIGRYVDNRERCAVRVSLGLQARLERTLYWSGLKLADGSCYCLYLLMKSAPEGMYVFACGQGDQFRLLDHDGNYVRTLYPFPAGQIAKVEGLTWREFPPGSEKLPSKLFTHDQDTLLPEQDVRDIAVFGRRACMISSLLMPMDTDGSTGGRALAGPEVGYKARAIASKFLV